MLLSYKVIENSKVVKKDVKVVETKYEPPKRKTIDLESNLIQENYDELAKTIIENAQMQSEDILKKAYLNVSEIEKDAYKQGIDKGYKEGYKKGYKKGYEESYEKNIKRAKEESELIVNESKVILENANKILMEAKYEYSKYLEDKKDEIKMLVLAAVKSVLKKEVLEEDAINDMVFDAIVAAKDAKTIIIKCNNKYIEQINSKVDNWKSQLAFLGEIFVIEDNTVSDGNAVIEKNNGKILVGIDIGLSKIKDILDGNDMS